MLVYYISNGNKIYPFFQFCKLEGGKPVKIWSLLIFKVNFLSQKAAATLSKKGFLVTICENQKKYSRNNVVDTLLALFKRV